MQQDGNIQFRGQTCPTTEQSLLPPTVTNTRECDSSRRNRRTSNKFSNWTRLLQLELHDTNPGEAFQFTTTYQGPGMTNQTVIQRTTEVTSVTDTTSIFTQ